MQATQRLGGDVSIWNFILKLLIFRPINRKSFQTVIHFLLLCFQNIISPESAKQNFFKASYILVSELGMCLTLPLKSVETKSATSGGPLF